MSDGSSEGWISMVPTYKRYKIPAIPNFCWSYIIRYLANNISIIWRWKNQIGGRGAYAGQTSEELV